jgi:hypothetical protein
VERIGVKSWGRCWPTHGGRGPKPLEGRAAAGCCAVGCVHTLFCSVLLSAKCAINGITTEPGHVGDRRKGILNARTSVALYYGLDVADREK